MSKKKKEKVLRIILQFAISIATIISLFIALPFIWQDYTTIISLFFQIIIVLSANCCTIASTTFSLEQKNRTFEIIKAIIIIFSLALYTTTYVLNFVAIDLFSQIKLGFTIFDIIVSIILLSILIYATIKTYDKVESSNTKFLKKYAEKANNQEIKAAHRAKKENVDGIDYNVEG